MKCSKMEVHTEIEACRTCGIFFLTSSNILRYLFSNEPEIELVRKTLETWKMQLNENDAYPKYICTICLLEFHRIFKFQNSVFETQEQLQQLYNLQQENIQKIKIKTEICEETNVTQKPAVPQSLPDDSNVCAFIYVDDMSDDEDDDEYGNRESRHITPFKIPHLPIKDEIIEEAYIPETETSLTHEMSVRENENEEEAPVEENATAIQCQLCLHVSEDQQQHRQHLLRIHESKPVECHVCGKQFPPGTTETRLKYHMKWHRINKHVKCAQCGFHCPSRDALKEHMRAVHTKTPCKICGKLLLPRKMRIHLEKHAKPEITQELNCPYCASYFSTNEERNQHISLFHNSAFEQLSMSAFNLHNTTLSSAQSDTETPESSCETTSTTVVSSSPNERSQHSIDSDDAAFEQLDETAENSAAASILEEYVESIAGCDAETEETADNSNETNQQEEDELEEMQFACAQCPESFNRVELLIAHAEVHTEKTKPFVCSVCGKAFDLKFSLNRHLKKHKNTTL